jgi:hypothetical protein
VWAQMPIPHWSCSPTGLKTVMGRQDTGRYAQTWRAPWDRLTARHFLKHMPHSVDQKSARTCSRIADCLVESRIEKAADIVVYSDTTKAKGSDLRPSLGRSCEGVSGRGRGRAPGSYPRPAPTRKIVAAPLCACEVGGAYIPVKPSNAVTERTRSRSDLVTF